MSPISCRNGSDVQKNELDFQGKTHTVHICGTKNAQALAEVLCFLFFEIKGQQASAK
jgi:hypothetical protein